MNHNKYHFLATFLIIVTSIIIYSNTLNSLFYLDDEIHIVKNRHIRIDELSLSKLKDAALKSPAHRRPVANITFAFNYYLGRLDPPGYHIVNIVIHIITGIAIYFFLYLTFQFAKLQIPVQNFTVSPFGAALVSTLLWATSPLQTQAVTYIVQRATSMATMFYILSLLCYVKGRRRRIGVRGQGVGVRSQGRLNGLLASGFWLLASLFFALLAFGSKEISATIPIVIILYEIFFFAKCNPVEVKKRLFYLTLLIIPFIVTASLYINRGDGVLKAIKDLTISRFSGDSAFTSIERLLTESRVVVYYLTLLILPLPSRLRLAYDISVSRSLIDPVTTILSIIFISGLIIYALYNAKKRPIISFFIIWFFLNLIIESSVIRLHLAFEHRLYLPSIGFFVVLTLGIIEAVEILKIKKLSLNFIAQNTKFKTTLLFLLFIGVQSTWAFQRNYVWQDSITLWKDNAGKTPDLSPVYNNLGIAYWNYGKLELAVKAFKDALKIDPNYSNIHYSLGIVYNEQGRLDLAMKEYQKVLLTNPNHTNAHNNIGNIYLAQGRLDLAMKEYQEVLRINPNHTHAHNNIGNIYLAQGRLDLAIDEYGKAIKINPTYYKAYYNIGNVYLSKGKLGLAIKEFQKVIRIKPDDLNAHLRLGTIYNGLNMSDLAIKEYQEVLKIKPGFAEVKEKIKRLGLVKK